MARAVLFAGDVKGEEMRKKTPGVLRGDEL
jgi:hypothetical protein